MSVYKIMTSSAKKSKWGFRRNVAVVEVANEDVTPKIITPKSKLIMRVVYHSGPCYVGKTEKCEYQRALKEAKRICDAHNHQAANERKLKSPSIPNPMSSKNKINLFA